MEENSTNLEERVKALEKSIEQLKADIKKLNDIVQPGKSFAPKFQ